MEKINLSQLKRVLSHVPPSLYRMRVSSSKDSAPTLEFEKYDEDNLWMDVSTGEDLSNNEIIETIKQYETKYGGGINPTILIEFGNYNANNNFMPINEVDKMLDVQTNKGYKIHTPSKIPIPKLNVRRMF